MTHLMHNNIILIFLLQKYDFIIQIEILLARTTAPTSLLIFNKDFIKGKSVNFVIKSHPFMYESKRFILVFQIVLACECANSFAIHALEKLYFVPYPMFLIVEKLFNQRLLNSKRTCDNNGTVTIHRKSHSFRSFAPFEFI